MTSFGRDLGIEPDLGVVVESPIYGWVQYTTEGPIGRDRHIMVYSPKARTVMMTGGGRATENDAWTWDGNTWTRIPSPPYDFRRDAAASEDKNGDVVMFGGGDETSGVRIDETWIWDGAQFTQRFPANVPPARTFASMAYDPERGVAVMFGGIGRNARLLNDTWEWDGNDWEERRAANPPAPREHICMTYDVHRRRVLMFGGLTGERPPATAFDDFFAWDGNDWSNIDTIGRPTRRGAAGMAYDVPRRAVVLFGGSRIDQLYSDSWELIDGRWNQVLDGASPETVSHPGVVFDRASQRIVMFGGWTGGGHAGITYFFDRVD